MCDQQSLRPACAYAQSDQSLCLSLEYSIIVKLLTERHLEFLSLKGSCTGSSESTLVKMSNCWKSHALAQIETCHQTVTIAENRFAQAATATTMSLQFVRINMRINRGSYMSAHVLFNLLNELGKRDKMRGLPSILSLFRNEFDKFNNTRARMLDSIYHMTNTLKSHFWRKNVIILSLCTQRCYGRHNVSRKSINH